MKFRLDERQVAKFAKEEYFDLILKGQEANTKRTMMIMAHLVATIAEHTVTPNIRPLTPRERLIRRSESRMLRRNALDR
jgi:hypothetical protein